MAEYVLNYEGSEIQAILDKIRDGSSFVTVADDQTIESSKTFKRDVQLKTINIENANKEFNTAKLKYSQLLLNKVGSVTAFVELEYSGNKPKIKFNVNDKNGDFQFDVRDNGGSVIDFRSNGEVCGLNTNQSGAPETNAATVGFMKSYSDNADTRLDNKLSNMISDDRRRISSNESTLSNHGSRITELEDKYEDSHPVGSIVPVWKYDQRINGRIKDRYLKCDGSDLNQSYSTKYDQLKRLLGSSYLPNLTLEGVFFGGGPNPGVLRDWTIPDWDFGTRYYGYNNWSKRVRGGTDAHESATYNVYGDQVKLSLKDPYKTHTNTANKFYPKHYNIEWYIKF